MDAIIYIRWSSAEQIKGDSRERQLRLCREHAERNGWRVIDEVEEDGVSAFKGGNRRSGKLALLNQKFADGVYPEGVVLLVERLDRLSRETPQQVFLWLTQVTSRGVVIATVDGSRTYHNTNLDLAAIMEVVVKAALANEESTKKSERIASAWAGKRSRLAQGDRSVMTSRAPAWLAVSDDKKGFLVLEDRAATIKRIFQETADGIGKHSIARKLNEEQVPTFGKSSAWHASYIQKILNSDTVIGTFQPGTKRRGEKRGTAGAPVKNYYPAVIDALLHARAKTSMKARSRHKMGRGRRIANLFSGLGKCAVCGGKMTLRSRGTKVRADGRTVHEDYLVCNNMQRGIIRANGSKCHNNVQYNYGVVERGVLDAVLLEAMDDTHFAEGSLAYQLAIELAEAKQRFLESTELVKKTVNLLRESSVEEVRELLVEAKQEREAAQKVVEDLEARLLVAKGTATPEEHAMRIANVRSELDDPDEDTRFRARSSVRQAIAELVEEMSFHRKGRRVGLSIVGGARNVVISADDSRIALDILPLTGSDDGNELSERQRRARERVLAANAVRRAARA